MPNIFPQGFTKNASVNPSMKTISTVEKENYICRIAANGKSFIKKPLFTCATIIKNIPSNDSNNVTICIA